MGMVPASVRPKYFSPTGGRARRRIGRGVVGPWPINLGMASMPPGARGLVALDGIELRHSSRHQPREPNIRERAQGREGEGGFLLLLQPPVGEVN